MRTLNAFRGKQLKADNFDMLNLQSLSDMEMNYVRGGGDPPQDDEPIDAFWPYPTRP